MNKEIKLKFKGKNYLLINGDNSRKEGAIATKEEWENFAPNYAHLFENGKIIRLGVEIGTIKDIEFLN